MTKARIQTPTDYVVGDDGVVDLSQFLSEDPAYAHFKVWLIGNTPLITHAWSEKARREMLAKHTKSTRAGREQRNPYDEFKASLYHVGTDDRTGKEVYGFPAMGVKNCILSAAHKDKGVARSTLMSALWIDGEMVKVQSAAQQLKEHEVVSDMPLIRIYGTDPQIREDMVKIGAGLNKTANLAYRGQFEKWAMLVTGSLNISVVTMEQLMRVVNDAGRAYGLGEWRNEKRGLFGSFRASQPWETEAWDAYAAGTGPLPEDQPIAHAAE